MEKEFRYTHERKSEGVRRVIDMLGIIRIEKDDEFRIICRKIPEKSMQVAIIIITTPEFSRPRQLCGACFRGNGIFGNLYATIQKRFVHHSHEHTRDLIRSFLFDRLLSRVRDNL